MMTALWQDLRFALRQLRRSPGFAITAVLTLALGVGANTAIFSLLDQALLRSLPVRDPKQLVILEGTGKAWQGRSSSHGGDIESYFSYPMYRDLRDQNKTFDGLLATSASGVSLQRRGDPSIVDTEIVSGNYFHVLGVTAAAGRIFTDTDDTPSGDNHVAVLSYEYWQSQLGGDSHVVGETVQVNAHPVVVVGVAAPGFRSAVWGQTPRIFLPMSMIAEIDPSQADALSNHKDRWINVIGRLHEGTTIEAAEVQLSPLWHALRAEELKALGKRSPRFVDQFLTKSQMKLMPGSRGLSYSREGLQKPLYVVMGMAALVLLIASVNVASLLLVRSAARVREISVRYALGATARRVVGQLLLEGMLIGVMGAAVGAALAPFAVRVLNNRLTSPGDPDFFQTVIDGRLLLFSLVISMIVSVVFSLIPAIRSLNPDLVGPLKQQTGTSGGSRLGFRRLIVSLQVGLSVVLLICAGLFVRTLQQLRHTDVGFNTAHLLSFKMDPQLAGVPTERVASVHRETLQALSALPGVQAVGATNSAELAGSDNGGNVTVEGYTAPPDEDLDIGRATVSTGYFQALQIPIVAGRAFTESDDLQHPLVAVVNQSFARHYFGSDAAAVGKRMARGAGNKLAWMQIVGVSRDTKHSDLRTAVKMTDFIPLQQDAKADDITVYLRTAHAPLTEANSVRMVMRRIDPGIALENMRSMDEQMEQTLNHERLIGLLAVSFGVLATLLAGIGLYGVLAYSTAQRTREIGIRMALGSSRARVSGMVLMDVLKLAGVGVLVAVPCALLLARTLRSQLYGVSATDPVTIVSVVALLAAVALTAALLPARRAANVNPNIALRTE